MVRTLNLNKFSSCFGFFSKCYWLQIKRSILYEGLSLHKSPTHHTSQKELSNNHVIERASVKISPLHQNHLFVIKITFQIMLIERASVMDNCWLPFNDNEKGSLKEQIFCPNSNTILTKQLPLTECKMLQKKYSTTLIRQMSHMLWNTTFNLTQETKLPE
jgi:hypothetical protein